MKYIFKKIFRKIINVFKMMKIWQIGLFSVLILFAFYIRILGLFSLGFYFDTVTTQYEWAKYAFENGYGNFWSSFEGFFDYLPGGLMYIMFIQTLAYIFGIIVPGGPEYDFVFFLKLFNNIYDFFIAVIIAFLARTSLKLDLPNKMLIFAGIFALPGLWIVSSIWGQFDSLIVFLGLVSVLLLYKGLQDIEENNLKSLVFWSGILFSVAFWTKIQVFMMIPVLLIVLFARETKKYLILFIFDIFLWIIMGYGIYVLGYYLFQYAENYIPTLIFLILIFLVHVSYIAYKNTKLYPSSIFAKWFWGFMVATWLMTFVALIFDPLRFLYNVAGPFHKENITTVGASNFWALVVGAVSADQYLISFGNYGLSISNIGFLIYMLLVGSVFFYFVNLRNGLNFFLRMPNLSEIFVLLAINCTAFFMFMTKMHSRYQIFGMVFSLIPIFLIKIKKLSVSWLLGSLLIQIAYFINQVMVFNYWNKDQAFMEYLFKNNIYLDKFINVLGVIGFLIIYFIGIIYLRSSRKIKIVE